MTIKISEEVLINTITANLNKREGKKYFFIIFSICLFFYFYGIFSISMFKNSESFWLSTTINNINFKFSGILLANFNHANTLHLFVNMLVSYQLIYSINILDRFNGIKFFMFNLFVALFCGISTSIYIFYISTGQEAHLGYSGIMAAYISYLLFIIDKKNKISIILQISIMTSIFIYFDFNISHIMHGSGFIAGILFYLFYDKIVYKIKK